jgi:hypothetical protein
MNARPSQTPVLQIGLQREAWGPRYWRILHTMAELSGQFTNTIMSNDEADAWVILLKSQAFVMPCKICKTHYLEWFNSNKVDKLRKLNGNERKDYIRKWLWECHKRVNIMNEKETPELDTLPELYPRQSIEKEVREIIAMLQLAISTQQLLYEDVKRWKLVIHRLRTMYSL